MVVEYAGVLLPRYVFRAGHVTALVYEISVKFQILGKGLNTYMVDERKGSGVPIGMGKLARCAMQLTCCPYCTAGAQLVWIEVDALAHTLRFPVFVRICALIYNRT